MLTDATIRRCWSDQMFALAELEDVIPLVRASVHPAICLAIAQGAHCVEVVAKHENHTPIGAFKVRGGIVYFDRLKRERPGVRAIVSATRGNHG
jgi:threonine dehydratase